MGKNIKREKNFFGDGYTYYDENGKKIGRSERNFFGDGYTNYDAKGNKVGRSEKNFFGDGYTNYDKNGKKIGKSEKNFFGGYTNYDANGKKIGKTENSLWDLNDDEFGDNVNFEGCYIATAVYGSYDCPQVWILRRYRDYFLYEHKLGRVFIKVYYKLSPKLVRKFGKTKLFNDFFRSILDYKVSKLKAKGYEDSRYEDRF